VASTESPTKLADRVQALRLPPSGKEVPGNSGLPWTLCAVLTCALAYVIFAGNPFQAAKEVEDESPAKSGPVAKQANVTSESNGSTTPAPAGEIALEAKGYIIPEQQILVSPQVSGRVIELNFDAGQRVDRNFVLAVLDNTEYLAEYDRMLATRESAVQSLAELEEGNRPDEKAQSRAELAEAETNLAQATRDFQRKKDLMERKIVSKEDFEAAESQYLALAKRVERLAASSRLMDEGARTERKRMARAQVQQIDADLRRAKWRLDNCVITAPISGTILKKNAELGNLVNPIAFNGSFSLCDIADLSKLEVELSIQERDISRVFKGQRCRVRAEAFPKRFYEGVVSRLMPIADRAKGALPVRVRLTVPAEEEGMYLKPEMGALVTFFNADPGNQGPSASPDNAAPTKLLPAPPVPPGSPREIIPEKTPADGK
jgi:HlyD family secretion protein